MYTEDSGSSCVHPYSVFASEVVLIILHLAISLVARTLVRSQEELMQQSMAMYDIDFLNLILLCFSSASSILHTNVAQNIFYRNNNAVQQIAWVPTQ